MSFFLSSHTRIIRQIVLGVYSLFLVVQAFIYMPHITYAMCSTTPTLASPAVFDAMIGDTLTYSFEYTNSGAIGYGPYVDVRLPAGVDGDDGITFNTSSYLGTPLVVEVLTATGGFVDHPYAVTTTGSQQVFINTGEQYVVIQLPFGSFTNGQSADISLSLDVDNYADVGTPLNVTMQPGFQYGCDATNNPSTDPSQQGGVSTVSISPTVFTVQKSFEGEESEMVPGGNFIHSYRITANIAEGQTINDMQLIDQLPLGVQYIGVTGITPAGNIITQPSTSIPTNNTDNEVIVNFGSVTGLPGGSDVSMVVEFYVPEFDEFGAPNIDPNTGDDIFAVNVGIGSGSRTPIDLDDTAGIVTATNSASATIKSIATQKSASISGGVAIPGAIVEYAIDFQIGDYFTYDTLVVTDILDDGLRHDTTEAPTFTISDSFGSYIGSFILNDTYIYDTSDIGNDIDSATSGTVTLTFNISEAITGGVHDGILQGGDALTGASSPAVGTIVYTAIIQEEYTDTYPSGDQSVDVGDRLNNRVTIEGNLLDNETLTFVDTESDTSQASVRINELVFNKGIYAINGSTLLPDPLEMFPGDDVTYRLTYMIPSSDLENLEVIDYLPLPIFDSSQVSTFDPGMSPAIPVSGSATYGPSDTLHTLTGPSVGGAPTILSNTGSNTLTFDYGTFDDPLSRPSTIDVLFTVTVSDEPFADGLMLTNLASLSQGSTNASDIDANSIIQVQLNQPELTISKGVVATTNTGSVFSPSTVGPVSFSSPGGSCARHSAFGSSQLSSGAIDSNIGGVDVGDIVTYALVVENVGGSDAYNILLKDALPTGIGSPSTLCITSGDGSALTYTAHDGNPGTVESLFGSGIRIDDTAQGSLDIYHPTNGSNILVITYDAVVTTGATPGGTLTNTGVIAEYTSTETGNDFVAEDIFDTSTAQIHLPQVSKSIIDTSEASTSSWTQGREYVVIGEEVEYQVVVEIPEGVVLPQVSILDNLDNGLVFVSLDSIYASGTLSSTSGAFASMTGDAIISNDDRDLLLNLGTVSNSDINSDTLETIVFEYTVRVDNTSANDNNNQRNNAVTISNNDFSIVTNAPNVRIREPRLVVNKTGPTQNIDSERVGTYSISIDHSGSTEDAFDVTLVDNLNEQGLEYVSGSYSVVGTAPDTITFSGGLVATRDRLDTNQQATISFDVNLDDTITTDSTLTNTATGTRTSILGDNAFERTFSGGVNDYTASDDHSINFIFELTPQKELIASSLAQTTGTTTTIGEELTYRLRVEVPELALFTGVSFTDTLDPELEFIAVDSFVASGTLYSSGVLLTGASMNQIGQQLIWNLGTLENTDILSSDEEFIEIVYRVRVANIAESQNNDIVNNSLVVEWSEGSNTDNAQGLTLIEPAVTLSKSGPLTNSNSDREITYQLRIEHHPTSAGDAYELTVSDVIPAQLIVLSGSQISGPIPSTVSYGQTFSASYDQFSTGDVAVFEITAKLDPTIILNTTVNNTASILWTNGEGTVDKERTGSGGVNDYSNTDSAGTYFSFAIDIDKQIQSTSIASTAGNSVTVGEIVTYEVVLTVPDETGFQLATLSDVLPTGLEFIAVESITSSSPSLTYSSGSITTGDQLLEIALGTITNTDTNDITQETITVVYTTRVTNSAEVEQGDDITNFASIQWIGGNQVIQSPVVTVIEPQVQLQKTAPASISDSNRAIQYSFTLSHENTSDSTAYDIIVEDILVGTSMVYISGSLQHTNGVMFDPSSFVTSGALTVVVPELLTGETASFSIDVQVSSDIIAPTSVTNTAQATWTGILGENNNERTGSGGVNNYSETDTATTAIVTSLSPSKTLTDTNIGYTSGTGVVEGEMLSYEVVIPIPENSTIHTIELTDTRDNELSFTGSVSITASGGLLLSEGSTATLVSNSSIVGSTLSIPMGDITNPDSNDTTIESVIISYDLIVGSGTSSNDILRNTASLTWSDGSTLDPVDVTVLEPQLTINKTSSGQISSSREITYTLTVDHTVASQTNAFDIQIIDDLNNLGMSVISVTQTTGPTTSINTSSDVVTLSLSGLTLSQDIAFEVVARLNNSVDTPTTISNTADLTWTSRTNNTTTFTDDSTAATAFATSSEGFTKTIIATNQPHSIGTGVVIGEEITYRLETSLPADATLNTLEITDLLPTGSRLVANDSISVESGVSCAPTACIGVNEDIVGQLITWSFGDITNSLTGSVQKLQIDYTIVVENDGVHSDGDTIANLATLRWSDNLVGDSAVASAVIIEPDLELTKSVASDNSATYGRTIQYTMTIDHSSMSSIDAYDVVISDNLTAHNMEYIPGSFVHESGNAPTTTTLTAGSFEVTYDALALSESSTVSFLARLENTVSTPTTISNTATTTWTSLANNNDPDERSGSGGVNTYSDTDTASTDFLTDISTTKRILSTSIDGSIGTGVLIGETITYAIDIEIPNDSIIFGLVVDDAHSTGLLFSGIQTIVSPVGVSSSLVGGFDGVSPTVSSTGSILQLGTITNTTSGSGSQTITITYDMVVSDDSAIVDGLVLTNQATVSRNQGERSKTTSILFVEVQEPSLRIEKTSLTGSGNIDSSRTVEYRILIDHDEGSEGDAYQVQLGDDLHSLQMNIDESSLVFSGYQPTTTGLISGVLSAEYETFPLGSVSEITFLATLHASVATPVMITNTSDMSWASGPGVGVRGYTDDDTATVTFRSSPGLIQKSIDTTSESHTSGTSVAVGEEVTYAVNIRIPENSTLNNAVITDLIPEGLNYLRLEGISADGSISVNSPTISTTSISSGTSMVFDFGSITNTDTNSIDTESVTIRYTVRVEDTPSSIENDSFQNRAVFTWSDESGETPSTTVFAPAIRIVEPSLRITKTGSTSNQESARTVSYVLDISHLAGSSSDAHDVVVTDDLEGIDLEVLTGTVMFSGVVGIITSYDPLVVTYPTMGTGQFSQVMFDARLDNSIETPSSRINTGTIQRSSLSGSSLHERTYDDEDIVSTIFTTTTTFDKQFIAGEQSHTLGTDVVVGEIVEYQITFPIEEDATLNNAVVTDLLPLGLAYLDTISIIASSAINAATTPSSIVPTYATGTNSLVYDFGNLTNTDTNSATQERIEITYRTVVDNIPSVLSGSLLTNSAQLEWSDSLLSGESTVRVVEPDLTLSKQALPSATSGARTITYAIQIGHTSGSMIDAYDIDFVDDLGIRNMDYIPESLTFTSSTTGSLSSNGDPLIITIDHLPVGQTVDFTFQSRLENTVPTNYTAVNTGSLNWTSTPGVNEYERTGTGMIAYTTSDTASLEFVTNTAVTMEVVQSNLSTSPLSTPVVGETTTYTIAIEVPEDGALTNSVGTLRLPSSVTLIGSPSYSVSGAVSSLAVGGLSGIEDTYTVGNNTVSFDFDTIINTNTNNTSTEYLYITYTVRIDNESGVGQGSTIQPSFDFAWSDASIVGVLPVTTLTVSEPIIDIIKTDTVGGENVNSARTITYQVEVTHSGASNADAYDLIVSDLLTPYHLSYISGSYQSVTGPEGVLDISNGIAMTYSHFPRGSTHIFRFDARLTNSFATDDTNPSNDITNIIDAKRTSIPGSSGNERTGIGGVNTYNDTDSTTVRFTSSGGLDKQVIATSHIHTSGSDVVVGEIITYAITIDIPEDSALNSLIVSDTMNTGLLFTGTSSITASGSIVSSIVGGYEAVVPTFTSGTNTLRRDLGTVANSDTTTGDVETVILTYDAVVTNIATVQDGVLLENMAQSVRTDGNAAIMAPSLIVQEPSVIFDLTTTDAHPNSSGQITYQFEVYHDNSSTADAFDAVLTIPASQYSGSIDIESLVWGGNTPSSMNVTPAGIELTFNTFERGETFSGSFTVQINETVRTQGVTGYVLEGGVERTSLPDNTGTQRTALGGVDDYTHSDTEITPLSLVDLELAYQIDQTSVKLGNQVVITVVLTNTGYATATNITIDLPFDEVFDIVSADGTLGIYNETTQTWSLNEVLSGTTTTLILTAQTTTVGDHTLPIQIASADQWDIDSYPGIIGGEDDEDSQSLLVRNTGSASSVRRSGGGSGETPNVEILPEPEETPMPPEEVPEPEEPIILSFGKPTPIQQPTTNAAEGEYPDSETPTVPLERLIECSGVLNNYESSQAGASCYLDDGVFNPSQQSDMSSSKYSDSIAFLTQQCYYHGPVDTQSLFKPTTYAKNGELIKIAIRMSQTLPASFSHFDALPQNRAVPYYTQARSIGLLNEATSSIANVYEAVTLYDVFAVYIGLLEYRDILFDTNTIIASIPSELASRPISREEFAMISHFFHTKLYPDQGNDTGGFSDELQGCLDLIQTKNDLGACMYDDGTFNSDQWSDIKNIPYANAVVQITDACLIHGPDDNQAQYRPFVSATNASSVKIAARMGQMLDPGFNHFDASPWYAPYYDALTTRGMIQGTDLLDPQKNVTLADLVTIYGRTLLRAGNDTTTSIESLIPSSFVIDPVNRHALAVITELFRTQIIKHQQ